MSGECEFLKFVGACGKVNEGSLFLEEGSKQFIGLRLSLLGRVWLNWIGVERGDLVEKYTEVFSRHHLS